PYYLLAGSGVLATGALLARRRSTAGFAYAAVLAATLAWALWESGLSFWPLLPRVFAPAVLGFFVLAVMPATAKHPLRIQAMLAPARASLGTLAVLASTVPATFTDGLAASPVLGSGGAPGGAPGDWRSYGRDPGGQRYAPFDQIGRENVKDLKVAWT